MVGVSDLFFWHVVNCMHDSRAPLDHLARFLDKELDIAETGGHVFLLATGDAQRIYDGFNISLRKVQNGMAPSLDGLSLEDQGHIGRFRIMSLLFHASAFYRRVLVPVESYPFKLFWFVKNPMDHPCSIRQSIAVELLAAESAAATLPPTAKKLLHLCPNDIRNAALAGTCGVQLL